MNASEDVTSMSGLYVRLVYPGGGGGGGQYTTGGGGGGGGGGFHTVSSIWIPAVNLALTGGGGGGGGGGGDGGGGGGITAGGAGIRMGICYRFSVKDPTDHETMTYEWI